jgi:hypothetical protein
MSTQFLQPRPTVAAHDINGDRRPDIVLSGAATDTEVNGVLAGPPGVRLQDPARAGTFLPIQNLR